MKKLLSLLLLLCSSLALAAQSISLSGTVRDLEGNKIIDEVIYLQIEGQEEKQISVIRKGTYQFYLPPGNHKALLTSSHFFPLKIEIDLRDKKAMTLDIKLEEITENAIAKRIQKGKITEDLVGKWKLTSIKKQQQKKLRLKKAKMIIELSNHEQKFGKLAYSTNCRGVHFAQFLQVKSPEILIVHEDYSDPVHTTDLRPCDKKHIKQKKAVFKILIDTLQDHTEVSYSFSKNKNKLKLSWNGGTIYLRAL